MFFFYRLGSAVFAWPVVYGTQPAWSSRRVPNTREMIVVVAVFACLATFRDMRITLLMVLLVMAQVSGAQVYKIINADGTIAYSDRAQEGAEEVSVPTLQTYEAPTNLDSAPASEDADEYPEYTLFEVVKPEHNEPFRDNGGYVAIQLSVRPGLFREHEVSIFVDGKDLGSSRESSINLQNVDRGSHTVHGVIRDKDGKEVERTSRVTFHLHKSTANN